MLACPPRLAGCLGGSLRPLWGTRPGWGDTGAGSEGPGRGPATGSAAGRMFIQQLAGSCAAAGVAQDGGRGVWQPPPGQDWALGS